MKKCLLRLRILLFCSLFLLVSGQSGCPREVDQSEFLRPDLRPDQAVQPSRKTPKKPKSTAAPKPKDDLRKGVRVHTDETSMNILRLQVALDRKHFSPGCLTGKINPQLESALKAFQQSKGLSATGQMDTATLRAIGHPGEVLTTYTVTSQDRNGLTPLPKTWPERAKMPRISYETVLERVAENAHASEALIRWLNPNVNWPNPPVNTQIKIPRSTSMPRRQASGLSISLAKKTIQAFDDRGRLVAHFPCSIGEKPEKRPRGNTRIKNCADDPTYSFNPKLFVELPPEIRGDKRCMIPPGANNPVGVAWIGFEIPSYGIHGTPDPEDIGITGSHGCFRVANWNARKLMKLIRIGMPVKIQ